MGSRGRAAFLGAMHLVRALRNLAGTCKVRWNLAQCGAWPVDLRTWCQGLFDICCEPNVTVAALISVVSELLLSSPPSLSLSLSAFSHSCLSRLSLSRRLTVHALTCSAKVCGWGLYGFVKDLQLAPSLPIGSIQGHVTYTRAHMAWNTRARALDGRAFKHHMQMKMEPHQNRSQGL